MVSLWCPGGVSVSQPGVPRWIFEEDSHHEEENNAEIKIMIRFEIKSCNGIKRILLELM